MGCLERLRVYAVILRFASDHGTARATYDASVKDSDPPTTRRHEERGYAPFETLRFDPTSLAATGAAPGFVRLERHLARFARSCDWLGLEFDRDLVIAGLRRAVAGLSTPHRVRITLTPEGQPEVEVTPLDLPRFNDTPQAALEAAASRLEAGGSLARAAVARQRVDESDPARSHKTTARELYYAAREVALRSGLDDIVFLDSRGRVAEGSIATVFVVGPGGPADVVTPPLSSGALPGVLREELLEHGLVQAREITEHELRSAAAVLLGSSVRGLRRVTLEPEPVDVT